MKVQEAVTKEREKRFQHSKRRDREREKKKEINYVWKTQKD